MDLAWFGFYCIQSKKRINLGTFFQIKNVKLAKALNHKGFPQMYIADLVANKLLNHILLCNNAYA